MSDSVGIGTWEQLILVTGAAGVLAAILWMIVKGLLVPKGHLQSEIEAREREERHRIREEKRHEETRKELRDNTRQLERVADSLHSLGQTLSKLSEIQRSQDRIENKFRKENDA